MVSSPKSPRPPSRNPSKPSSSTPMRAPKRLPATPSRPTPKAKRVASTPQRAADPMTPSRAPTATRASARLKAAQKEQSTLTRTPKRAAASAPVRTTSKKRAVGELTPRRALPTTIPEASSPKPSSVPEKSKDEKNVTPRSKSLRKNSEAKKQKVSQRRQNKKDSQSEDDIVKETSDSPRATKIQKKRQPSVKLVKSQGREPSPKKPKLQKEQEESEKSNGERVPKSKSNKKRPTAGKFDLPVPDVSDEERSLGASVPESLGSPKITINESMSESKLRLLESSPLNRLISEKDRKAAAAELAALKAEGKLASGFNSKDSFVPLDKTAYHKANEGSVDNAKVEAARKKEARKLKRKIRQLRMKGELPDSDDEEDSKKTGVVYLGHIPHGFYEKEMRSYFSQFGEVARLKLSRSKKTGRSRGFAFLEFSDKDVASIAAESMDGYLMHGQALVAKVVPEEKVHPDTFKGADRTFRKIPWSSIERRKLIDRAKDPLKLAARSRRVRKQSKRKLKLLSKKGIKYDFPELST